MSYVLFSHLFFHNSHAISHRDLSISILRCEESVTTRGGLAMAYLLVVARTIFKFVYYRHRDVHEPIPINSKKRVSFDDIPHFIGDSTTTDDTSACSYMVVFVHVPHVQAPPTRPREPRRRPFPTPSRYTACRMLHVVLWASWPTKRMYYCKATSVWTNTR